MNRDTKRTLNISPQLTTASNFWQLFQNLLILIYLNSGLHKYAASNIEQVLEAAPNKAAAVRPSATHHQNYPTRHAGHCWRCRDELISDIPLWTPSHGWAKARQPARTYIQQLCADTGCSLEDLPREIDNRHMAEEGQGDPWWQHYIMMRKFRISLVWCHHTKLLCHLIHVSNFTVFPFLQPNLWQDKKLFCLHLVFLWRNDSS